MNLSRTLPIAFLPFTICLYSALAQTIMWPCDCPCRLSFIHCIQPYPAHYSMNAIWSHYLCPRLLRHVFFPQAFWMCCFPPGFLDVLFSPRLLQCVTFPQASLTCHFPPGLLDALPSPGFLDVLLSPRLLGYVTFPRLLGHVAFPQAPWMHFFTPSFSDIFPQVHPS